MPYFLSPEHVFFAFSVIRRDAVLAPIFRRDTARRQPILFAIDMLQNICRFHFARLMPPSIRYAFATFFRAFGLPRFIRVQLHFAAL